MAADGRRKRKHPDAFSFPVLTKVRVLDPELVAHTDPDIPSGTIAVVCKPEDKDGFISVHAPSMNITFEICRKGLEILEAEADSFPIQVMKNMWVSRKQSGDVVLGVGADEVVTHRCVLESVSPVFAAALNGAMKEGIAQRLDLTDTSKETLEGVLQLVYTGSEPAALDVVSALEFARKYMMIEVARRLGMKAILLTNWENAAHIARLLKDFDGMEGSDTHFVDALVDAHSTTKDIMKAIVRGL